MNVGNTTECMLFIKVKYLCHYAHFREGFNKEENLVNLCFYKKGLIGEGDLIERGPEDKLWYCTFAKECFIFLVLFTVFESCL